MREQAEGCCPYDYNIEKLCGLRRLRRIKSENVLRRALRDHQRAELRCIRAGDRRARGSHSDAVETREEGRTWEGLQGAVAPEAVPQTVLSDSFAT